MIKSWFAATIVWLVVMGSLLVAGWPSNDYRFCDGNPECMEMAKVISTKRPKDRWTAVTVTVLPPIVALLTIVFWNANWRRR